MTSHLFRDFVAMAVAGIVIVLLANITGIDKSIPVVVIGFIAGVIWVTCGWFLSRKRKS
jgi:predicted RNA-binding protein with PUA domain